MLQSSLFTLSLPFHAKVAQNHSYTYDCQYFYQKLIYFHVYAENMISLSFNILANNFGLTHPFLLSRYCTITLNVLNLNSNL